MIRLSVPGTLEYRDVAMRVVSAAAKLVQPGRRGTQFDAQVVSAFGEAFNNIAIHGYTDRRGEVAVEIQLEDDRFLMRISDHGRSFDPLEVPDPELDDLPERGMGLFIIRSFVDSVTYTPGNPNVLELVKRCVVADHDSAPPAGPPPPVSVPPSAGRSAPPGPLKASKSGRASPSRVRPVRRADSVPPRARGGNAVRREQPADSVRREPPVDSSPADSPADEALPLGSRRK